jgi:hypothetical protein
MFQRDFLMRQIEEFGRFMGYLLKLRKEGKNDQALQEIGEVYKGFADLDKALVSSSSTNDLVDLLVNKQHLPVHKLRMVSDLLYEEGENLVELGNDKDSKCAFKKCLILIRYLQKNDDTYSFEWLTKIKRIEEFLEKDDKV